jgi:trk system potassium uptake protein TrkH
MLVGGASGSTAGGFKMTTLAVLFMTTWAVFRHRGDVQCFGRRISTESVYNAITILVLYLLLFLAGGISISMIDSVPLISALFESASAVATVGLSLNMTPELSTVSQIILMVLMFFGRVGGLTLIFSMFSDKKPAYSKFPEEQMTVG